MKKKFDNISFETFNKIFNKEELLPLTKKEYMERIYKWWVIGKHNREDEIINLITYYLKR